MKIYDKVYKLLNKHPQLRDDDKKLCWSYWAIEGKAWNTMTKEAYLSATSESSITRAKRKVQEEHPELRGKSYESRQSLSIEARDTHGVSVYRD